LKANLVPGELHDSPNGDTLRVMSNHSLSRRAFLQTVGAAAAAAPFLSIRARAAGPVLRHASIGASGQALGDLLSFAKHPAFDLVAVADVDLARFERVQERFPKVRVYQDWRELLKKEQKNIDSVNVSTPDHMHCLIGLEAMKHGKAVYVQKPLCNTLHETRLLTEYARRKNLTTQMGIQVSSSRSQRFAASNRSRGENAACARGFQRRGCARFLHRRESTWAARWKKRRLPGQ